MTTEEPIRVHIIDDEKELCNLYEVALSLEPINGRKVVFEKSYSGEEGLDKLQKNCPDILILDLIMPNMHGSDVYKKITERSELKKLKTIILSANIEESPDTSSPDVLYAEKPIAMDRLRRMIGMLAQP